MGNLTHHNRGTGRCAEYLRSEYRCSPVITEAPVLSGKERVDAIGFPPRQPSVVIDWKESMQDARAHMKKEHVRLAQAGVGQLRFIACRQFVVEWEEIRDWPEWLGLLWLTEDDEWIVRREAQQLHKFNLFAEREILRAYASKAGYQQKGAVQRQTWLDKAAQIIAENGPTRIKDIIRDTGIVMTPIKAARDMEKDPRFIRTGAGEPFDLIHNHNQSKDANYEDSGRAA